MKPVEIYNMNVQSICADDCVLFMWATYPMLPEALYAFTAWGFYYKTVAFTWIKKNKKSGTNFFGMGKWTRRNTEVLLLGTRGNPKPISHNISEIIEHKIMEHSKKPPIIRDKIVELCGNIPRVELFAREKADGWDVWGNEVNNSIRLNNKG